MRLTQPFQLGLGIAQLGLGVLRCGWYEQTLWLQHVTGRQLCTGLGLLWCDAVGANTCCIQMQPVVVVAALPP